MRSAKLHPRTLRQLQPVGHRANGTPIWPILGGSEPAGTEPAGDPPAGDPKPDDPDPDADPDPDDPDAKKRAQSRRKASPGDLRGPLPDDLDPEIKGMIERLRGENGHWRREYRTEQQAREAEEKKRREEEDAQRPELERVTEKATQLEASNAQLTLQLLRLQVAYEQGLSYGQAKRLVGDTREEIEQDAEDVKKDFPTATSTPAPPPSRPREGLKPGAAPAGDRTGPEPTPGKGRMAAAYAESANSS